MSSKRNPNPSLQHRLRWSLGLLVISAMVALVLLAGWIARQASLSFVATRLSHDAETLIVGIDPKNLSLQKEPPKIYEQPLSGHYFQIAFPEERGIRSRSLWDDALLPKPQLPGTEHTELIKGPREQQLLVLHTTYTKQGIPFTVSIAEDIAPILSDIKQFSWYGLILAVLSTIVLLFIQTIILRKAFSRFEVLGNNVRDIRQGKRSALENDVPVEIGPLVQEFNKLLSTWREHLQRSRKSTGNLAHALKSPLYLIYQSGIENDQPVVQKEAEKMQQIIEREMNRARIAGAVSVGRQFHPKQSCTDLIKTIQILFEEKNLDITAKIKTPEQLPLEQDDMMELLGNLIDNAAKWATHQVHLSLRADKDLHIEVHDDGPGINNSDAEYLTKRGKRLDEQTSGHGLGLSIVKDIVEQYQGSFSLEHSTLRSGTCARVVLPLITD